MNAAGGGGGVEAVGVKVSDSLPPAPLAASPPPPQAGERPAWRLILPARP